MVTRIFAYNSQLFLLLVQCGLIDQAVIFAQDVAVSDADEYFDLPAPPL